MLRIVGLSPVGLALCFWAAAALAQDLPADQFVGLKAGTFVTIEQAGDHWRMIDHGKAADVPVPSKGLPNGEKNTVRFVFEADGQRGMRLMAWNGYPMRLVYKGAIQLQEDSRPARTSLCPIGPQLLGIELWPQQIDQLDLAAFQLVDDVGPAECK